MLLIELPRALDVYFAFAECDATRRGRRFSITLPYLKNGRIERLQWWYHVTPAQELMFEGHGVTVFRARAIERFGRHIQRWLEINAQHLHGDGPIPCVSSQPAAAPALLAEPPPAFTAEILPWPAEKIANG